MVPLATRQARPGKVTLRATRFRISLQLPFWCGGLITHELSISGLSTLEPSSLVLFQHVDGVSTWTVSMFPVLSWFQSALAVSRVACRTCLFFGASLTASPASMFL